MIGIFIKSIGQLGDRAVLTVLLQTMILSLLVFTALGWLVFTGFQQILAGRFGDVNNASGLAGLLAVLATIFGAWLLWRIVSLSILQLFADQVVDAVERRHYPQYAALAKAPKWGVSMGLALKSLRRAMGYNLLALPVYLVLLFTGIGAPLVFLMINAVLIGRDLDEMVAVRHVSPNGAIVLLPRRARFLLGLFANILLLIPFVNLLAPIVAACMATHLVNQHLTGNRAE